MESKVVRRLAVSSIAWLGPSAQFLDFFSDRKAKPAFPGLADVFLIIRPRAKPKTSGLCPAHDLLTRTHLINAKIMNPRSVQKRIIADDNPRALQEHEPPPSFLRKEWQPTRDGEKLGIEI